MLFPEAKTIGERVRKARVLSKLTLKQLSAETGIGYATISRIESGKRIINAVELLRIAKITKKPIMFFFEEEDNVIEYFYPYNYKY